jgi:hypothetical protein
VLAHVKAKLPRGACGSLDPGSARRIGTIRPGRGSSASAEQGSIHRCHPRFQILDPPQFRNLVPDSAQILRRICDWPRRGGAAGAFAVVVVEPEVAVRIVGVRF